MSAQHIRRYLDPEYAETWALFRQWAERSLTGGHSLLPPDRFVWNSDVATDLERRIALAPDLSQDTFVGKLVGQLDGAGQEVPLLLADLLVIHLLATNNIGLKKKLEIVNAFGAMAPEPFEVPDAFHPALRRGPVNAGIGFLTLRFWIVSFMIRFAVG